MAIPEQLNDREKRKFRESTIVPEHTVVAVTIEQDPSSSVPVTNYFNPDNIFYAQGDANAVASGASATILTYVIPLGKDVLVKMLAVGGDNIARYTLELDSVIVLKTKTYFQDFDRSQSVLLAATAGQTITVNVDNYRPTSANFSATLFGEIQDAV